MKQAEYSNYPFYQKGGAGINFPEKSLEHYIALQLLELSSGDVYIDIANDNAPVPEIYGKFCNIDAYRQDLQFPDGINNKTIGGNAAKMPIDKHFVDKMTLHCSFEHFENDADIEFIQEAQRVLKPGGKLCIIPLYLGQTYSIITDPCVHRHKDPIHFEKDATLHCVHGYFNRHGRLYDPEHFVERIVSNIGNLELELYEYTNASHIHSSCYLRWVAVFTKPL